MNVRSSSQISNPWLLNTMNILMVKTRTIMYKLQKSSISTKHKVLCNALENSSLGYNYASSTYRVNHQVFIVSEGICLYTKATRTPKPYPSQKIAY